MLELTQDQVKAMEKQRSTLHVVNPQTGEVYVVVRKDIYDLTCAVIGGGKGSPGMTKQTTISSSEFNNTCLRHPFSRALLVSSHHPREENSTCPKMMSRTRSTRSARYSN